MKQQKSCVICGKPFASKKSGGNATCSPECSAKRRKNIQDRKKQGTCVVCGKLFYYPPQQKRVTCSSECAAQRRKNIREKNQKTCVICGKLFHCPVSNMAKVTCSPECSKQNRANKIKSGVYAMASQQANEARKNMPHLGPTEENIHAKRWIIQAPDGKIYELRNLKLWLREHADWLDGTPEQASCVFSHIKRTMQNKRKKGGLYQWKGWRLIGWDD